MTEAETSHDWPIDRTRECLHWMANKKLSRQQTTIHFLWFLFHKNLYYPEYVIYDKFGTIKLRNLLSKFIFEIAKNVEIGQV
jgi:hypothetical protein